MQCPELSYPTNGIALSEHILRGVGDVVEYTCSSGYVLVGTPSRTCQPDGTWSDTAPECIKRKYNFTDMHASLPVSSHPDHIQACKMQGNVIVVYLLSQCFKAQEMKD